MVNTHLHFDHCGWNTRIDRRRSRRPRFRTPRYIRAAGRTRACASPHRARPRQLLPGKFRAHGQDGAVAADRRQDERRSPRACSCSLPGHNRDMMCVRLTGGGQTAMLPGRSGAHDGASCRCPGSWASIFIPWIRWRISESGFRRLCAVTGWRFSAHDPGRPAARLRERDGKVVAEPVAVD